MTIWGRTARAARFPDLHAFVFYKIKLLEMLFLSCCLFLFSKSHSLVLLNSMQSNTIILMVMVLNAFFGQERET